MGSTGSEPHPPIARGSIVVTTEENVSQRGEWQPEGRIHCQWGIEGVVITHHDGHGLCYEVNHGHGKIAVYDPAEIQFTGRMADDAWYAEKGVPKPFVKHLYRISAWRHDVPKRTYSTPEFEGVDLAACDKLAVAYFHRVSSKEENEWEGMDIVRVDAPALAEKVTFLESNGWQEGDLD